jgi:uncharacterized protein
MKYPINQLLKHGNEPFEVDETVDFSSIAEKHHEIRAISDVIIRGTGRINNKMIIFDLNISCELTLPCAITLEDVNYPIDIQTTEYFTYDDLAKEEDFEDDVTIIKGQFVELAPVVWQNIIVHIPLRVVSKNAYERIETSGKNFELIEKTDNEEVEHIDPRFAKLKDLLNK